MGKEIKLGNKGLTAAIRNGSTRSSISPFVPLLNNDMKMYVTRRLETMDQKELKKSKKLVLIFSSTIDNSFLQRKQKEVSCPLKTGDGIFRTANML